MQELELNYPVAKGKVYSEEEDRYLLCRLNHYGLKMPDVYDRIKKDITEFPVFRFDWFFKSRTPQELSRRCHTLLGLISKEYEDDVKEEKPQEKKKAPKAGGGARGTVRSPLIVSIDTKVAFVIETFFGGSRSRFKTVDTFCCCRDHFQKTFEEEESLDL